MQSCKQLGHTHQACQLDPNPKGKVVNWEIEKKRVKRLVSKKRFIGETQSSSFLDDSGKQDLVIEDFGFTSSESYIKVGNDCFFTDLQMSKEDVDFKAKKVSYMQNKFDIEEVLTKEMEASLRRKSVRVTPSLTLQLQGSSSKKFMVDLKKA